MTTSRRRHAGSWSSSGWNGSTTRWRPPSRRARPALDRRARVGTKIALSVLVRKRRRNRGQSVARRADWRQIANLWPQRLTLGGGEATFLGILPPQQAVFALNCLRFVLIDCTYGESLSAGVAARRHAAEEIPICRSALTSGWLEPSPGGGRRFASAPGGVGWKLRALI